MTRSLNSYPIRTRGKMVTKEFLSCKEFSEKLNISVWSVYKLVKQKRLKVIKVGGIIRIPQDAATELLVSSEKEQEAEKSS